MNFLVDKIFGRLGILLLVVFCSLSVSVFAESPEERIARLKLELEIAQSAAGYVEGTDHVAPEKEEVPTNALVIIETEDGGGSGFIAKIKGRSFLVTNIHVLAAARGARVQAMNGDKITLPNVAYLSEDRDLVIVPIEWEGAHFKISTSLPNDNVRIGDSITVMGNSDAAGVATKLKGVINGIGPEELEVSAKFAPGNSGSPIIHDDLGVAVGLVSHMRDLSDKDKWTKDSELADIRRFGFRLDGEISWQLLSLQNLYKQGELYDRFEDRTIVLAQTVYAVQERVIMTGFSSHESLGYMFDHFDGNFSWKRGTGSGNNMVMLNRFLKNLNTELVNDRQSTEEALTVKFFNRRFQEIDSVRDYSIKELKKASF